MRRRFVTLDVFTQRRFAGNPLAVVLEAQDLDTAAMQTIAREFNHPETVFVLPPAVPARALLAPEVGVGPGAAAAAAALSPDPADIGFDGLRPSRWSAGIAQTFVPVRSLAAIARARPDPARFDAT